MRIPSSYRLRSNLAPVAAAASLALMLSGPAAAQLSFSDQTQAAGLNVSLAHAADHPAMIMDGGGTVGDFNADGWPDLFVPSGGLTPDRLFINNQDGTFTDEAAAWGLTELHRGCGSTAGDYNNDGWMDIFVTSFGPMSGSPSTAVHRLYENTGTGAFVEVAAAAGVSLAGTVPDGFGAAFGDLDLDGDLDLFVCGWVASSGGNCLFQNNGDGTFTDITAAAGVQDITMQGFSPRFADINGDRYPDLLVAADFGTTRVFHGKRDGTFEDLTSDLQPDIAYHGMGNSLGDIDNDGDLDWYLTATYENQTPAYPNGNRLYQNNLLAGFDALPETAGVNDAGFCWGTVMADFDHDGLQDIAATNGWPNDPQWINEQSYLFLNDGDLTFTENALGTGFNHFGFGRGMVRFDYDRDGDQDVVIFANQDTITLLRNDIGGADTHWLEVELDTSAHPDLAPHGFGTRLVATVGGQSYVRYLDGGSTYLGRNQLIAHFGLGSATVVDELRVEWADGFTTTLTAVPADQIVQVAAQPPLESDPLVRGMPADLRVHGAEPGENVHFVRSLTGIGAGTFPQALGGHLQIDILHPLFRFAPIAADASGTATLSVTVPSSAPLIDVYVQAFIQRGASGSHSAKTNAIAETVLP